MEKKIIIFTSSSKIKNVYNINLDDPIRPFFTLIEGDYMFIIFDENRGILSPANLISDGRIFLLNDEIKEPEFTEFIVGIEPNDLFILTHSFPDYIYRSSKLKIGNLRKGKHRSDGEYYPAVFKALETSEGDVFDIVFNILFTPKKEIVLEFLNNCIVSEPELPQELLKENAIVKQYKIWKSKKESKELLTLRDMLLSWVKSNEK